MIKKVLIFAAAGVAILLIIAGGLMLGFLSSWGVSWRTAHEIDHRLDADAAAVRDAEGPIRTPNGIAERGFVRIGGIDQWITIRGQDRRNPVILVLHGGPGDAYSQLAYLLRPWEKDFTVVQWDQRGAGRTYGRYGKATPDLTLERMIEDGAEVADYARRRVGQRKIVLLGHSWGSALGVCLLKRHPELFSAYVGTGQLVNTVELDRSRYAYTLARLAADHRTTALDQVRRLGPPPYATDAQDEVVRRQLNRYLASADDAYLYTSIALMLRNPRYSLGDFRDLMAGHLDFSLERLHRTYEAIDLPSLGYQMPTPFFIIDGRDDRLAPPDLAEAYFQKIQAPRKAMILIDGGHFAFMSNATSFLQALDEHVRPIAMQDSGAYIAPALGPRRPGHP
ncbi:MAG TPA: alpha/beta fold hydrolase [Caulobacteraceae bacterium]